MKRKKKSSIQTKIKFDVDGKNHRAKVDSLQLNEVHFIIDKIAEVLIENEDLM